MRKPLIRKDLRRNGRAEFDATPYITTLYDNLANDVPIMKEKSKSFVKISWQENS